MSTYEDYLKQAEAYTKKAEELKRLAEREKEIEQAALQEELDKAREVVIKDLIDYLTLFSEADEDTIKAFSESLEEELKDLEKEYFTLKSLVKKTKYTVNGKELSDDEKLMRFLKSFR